MIKKQKMVFKQRKITKIGLRKLAEHVKKREKIKLICVRSHVFTPETPGRLRKNSEELEVLKRSLRAIRRKANQRPEPLIEPNQRPVNKQAFLYKRPIK